MLSAYGYMGKGNFFAGSTSPAPTGIAFRLQLNVMIPVLESCIHENPNRVGYYGVLGTINKHIIDVYGGYAPLL